LDGVELKPIGKSQMSIFGASRFKSLSKGFPYSLDGQPFILPPKHSKIRYEIEHYFQDQKIHYDLVAEVQDSSLKKILAENGKALIFLSDFAASNLVQEKKLIKIGEVESLQEEFWLLTSKRTIANDITGHLIDSFRI
jgi:LysR family transcriptional activator of nhaA